MLFDQSGQGFDVVDSVIYDLAGLHVGFVDYKDGAWVQGGEEALLHQVCIVVLL